MRSCATRNTAMETVNQADEPGSEQTLTQLRLNVAFKCDNRYFVRKLLISALVHTLSLMTEDHLFSTFNGSRFSKILSMNYFPRLSIIVSLFEV